MINSLLIGIVLLGQTTNEQSLFVSKQLKTKFLNSTLIDFRTCIEKDKSLTHCELELRNKNKEKIPKYSSVILNISAIKSNVSANMACGKRMNKVYIIKGIPKEILKEKEILELRILNDEMVNLSLYSPNKKLISSIDLEKLTFFPEEFITIKSEEKK